MIGTPLSTYRLQMNAQFPFYKALSIADYLEQLGVGALYLSPILLARPGSTHGYDICDHHSINPELGGEEAFHLLAKQLKQKGMGCVVDAVPNHMGADPASNPWWWDVLENGPSSPFSHFFDIDWFPLKPELHGKVLLPVLGDQYGKVLERGELKVSYDNGSLILNYYEKRFPVNPRLTEMVLAPAEPSVLGFQDPEVEMEFLSVLTAFRNLPKILETHAHRVAERQREKEIARKRLATLVDTYSEVQNYVQSRIIAFNGVVGESSSFDRMHAFLEMQAYRLAYWRTAGHEINYRRFFDINDLLGIRVEDAEVFESTHELLLREVAAGHITGIRLDHIDGLYDPEKYLEQLRDSVQKKLAEHNANSPLLYIVVEKILSGEESLPSQWPVQGTTGYEFLNEVNGLFVDLGGLMALQKTHARFCGIKRTYEEEVWKCKRLILDTSMGSELNVLANLLNRMSEADRKCRDFTLETLRDALREVIVSFTVYRTYISPRGQSDSDRNALLRALEIAETINPAMESSVFLYLQSVLLPFESDDPERPGATLPLDDRLDAAMRFQQLSSPIQAKGVEDTAFYRYGILYSLNDVGGEPNSHGLSVEAFHQRMLSRRQLLPYNMLATATHDTKRGEDARARITAISWRADTWRRLVGQLARLAERFQKMDPHAQGISRSDEYFVYQVLAGSWPLSQEGSPIVADSDWVERVHQYLVKAVREAKVHTSWINPDSEYEGALLRFVDFLLVGQGRIRFQNAFFPVVSELAKLGAVNSLVQLALKCATPGIPDIYQGTEFWDLSLVDPDNRRPVDYELRSQCLQQMLPMIEPQSTVEGRMDFLNTLWQTWPDAQIKQYVMARCLRWRKAYPEVFLEGEYLPLTVLDGNDSYVAFARLWKDYVLVVGAKVKPHSSEHVILDLHADWKGLPLTELFTGHSVVCQSSDQGRATLDLAPLLEQFPVLWLWGEWSRKA